MRLRKYHLKWKEACRPAYYRLMSSQGHCRQRQESLLMKICRQNAEAEYGRLHHFSKIQTHSDFISEVPLCDYEDVHPFIERMQQGEKNVLTSEQVRRLHISSGTSQASKLIPFTNALGKAFQTGIQPWMFDLYSRYPGLLDGSFYWVISPPVNMPSVTGAISVGFENDGDYLDTVGRNMFSKVSALGETVSTETDVSHFYLETWAALLQRKDLSMISFWSPRFFLMMWQMLPELLEKALFKIKKNGNSRRAAEIRDVFRHGINSEGLAHEIWPDLSLISCWTEGWASLSLPALQCIFKGIPIQGKGLMATEGIVSIPLGCDSSGSMLCVQSHFFEFEDQSGHIRLADQLESGQEYHVVITTQGGLYRYRLGDVVRIVGFTGDIPRLEFLSKGSRVVDLCGEKLNEAHVGRIILNALRRWDKKPDICFLAPLLNEKSFGYGLFMDGNNKANMNQLCREIEKGLNENYYYAHGRKMGQLSVLKPHPLNQNSIERYKKSKGPQGRLGTRKPIFLEPNTDWLQMV